MAGVAYSKIDIINDALISTGNDPCEQDDGSTEWIAASKAYERCLPLLLYGHEWPFQTKTAPLVRIGCSMYPGYTDIYEKPADCLHVENVWRTDLAPLVPQTSFFGLDGENAIPPELDYKIIGDQIHCCGPGGVTSLYTQIPGPNVAWSTGFVEALRRRIESLLAQGLNEDYDAAKELGAVALQEEEKAAARADQEQPRRVAFRSRHLEHRRTRRTGWWL